MILHSNLNGSDHIFYSLALVKFLNSIFRTVTFADAFSSCKTVILIHFAAVFKY